MIPLCWWSTTQEQRPLHPSSRFFFGSLCFHISLATGSCWRRHAAGLRTAALRPGGNTYHAGGNARHQGHLCARPWHHRDRLQVSSLGAGLQAGFLCSAHVFVNVLLAHPACRQLEWKLLPYETPWSLAIAEARRRDQASWQTCRYLLSSVVDERVSWHTHAGLSNASSCGLGKLDRQSTHQAQ